MSAIAMLGGELGVRSATRKLQAGSWAAGRKLQDLRSEVEYSVNVKAMRWKYEIECATDEPVVRQLKFLLGFDMHFFR